jgi:hypothetical protein
VAKLAVMTERVSDLRTLLEGAGDAASTVLIGLGRTGVATRVLAGRFGSRWTYAGAAIAPGQIPIAQLLGEYRFRRVGPMRRSTPSWVGRSSIVVARDATRFCGAWAQRRLRADRDARPRGPARVRRGHRASGAATIPFKQDDAAA